MRGENLEVVRRGGERMRKKEFFSPLFFLTNSKYNVCKNPLKTLIVQLLPGFFNSCYPRLRGEDFFFIIYRCCFVFSIVFFMRKFFISSGSVASIPKYSGNSFVVVSISVVPCFLVCISFIDAS